MFFPLLDHNITCSHLERDLLALVLFLSLGSVAQPLGGVIFWQSGAYAIGRFTTREWLMLLHDLVSVFHQNFLSEWLLFNICIYCYLVVICLTFKP
jgi:hypothetical protein